MAARDDFAEHPAAQASCNAARRCEAGAKRAVATDDDPEAPSVLLQPLGNSLDLRRIDRLASGTATAAMGPSAASLHDASAGRISVDTDEVASAARYPAEVSACTLLGPLIRLTKSDIGSARLSMSLVSGASYCR